MTVMLTYDATLSRVQIAVTGISAIADVVTVERSTDQATWRMVRGGGALIPSAQRVSVDDYEFSANVQNYYRAISYDTAPSSYVTGGPGVSGNNVSLTPPMPIGRQAGDLILVEASIRNSPTGQPVAPAGYLTVMDAVNFKLFGRIITGAAEPAPTVTFTGGVVGADTLAQTACFRNTSLTVGNVATQLNASQQDIPRAALTVPADNMVLIYAAWKQSVWTSITPGPAPFAAIQGDGVISSAGGGAAQAWSYRVQTAKADLPVTMATVVGGVAAISRQAAVAFYHQDLVTNTDTGSITPVLTTTWIKVVARPFLNRPIKCIPNISDFVRRARQGIFPVVGRSFPIAVTDVRGSREFSIEIITQTTQQRTELDLIFASGDTYFFHSPPDNPMPTLYAAVNDVTTRRPLRNRSCGNDWRVFALPIIEVAAPTSSVVGAIGTWQTVINTYPTWQAVLNAHVDWASLLTLVGTPTDIIVP